MRRHADVDSSLMCRHGWAASQDILQRSSIFNTRSLQRDVQIDGLRRAIEND